MKCRHCGAEPNLTLIDLGSAPPSNAYLTQITLHKPEKWFPLRVLVCDSCWLVQTEDFAQASDLFDSEYAYFSSFSTSFLTHAKHYVARMVERFGLNAQSHVIEVAANDGYLLQYMKQEGIPCLGIEPTASTAAAARMKGINMVEEFFGVRLANKLRDAGKQADLILANNVIGHVPDINDFVAGFALLLKPQGVATFEFPHLMRLIDEKEFDTIYHEHFSYLSFTTANRVFSANGLTIFDVEELTTHGGSLRVYAQLRSAGPYPVSTRVSALSQRELAAGMSAAGFYAGFQEKANQVKDDLLAFLINTKRSGKKVAAYGAAAKGNTLLNYAGVRSDLVPFVADLNPVKQGKFLPGSRIPVVAEVRIREETPDYLILLPWNLREELMNQLSYIRNWNGQFVTAVPNLAIC